MRKIVDEMDDQLTSGSLPCMLLEEKGKLWVGTSMDDQLTLRPTCLLEA